MRKFIYTFMALLLLSAPAFAADKAKLKVGAAKGVAKEGIVAAAQGSFINITMGGTAKKGSATVTLLVPADFSPEKGQTFELFSGIGESSSDNPGALSLIAFGTTLKGRNVFTYTATEDSKATGKLTVKSYDAATKELKFQVNAKISPYTIAKAGLSGTKTKVSNKNMAVKVNAVVTLP